MTRTVIAMSASADAADLAEAMVDADVRSIPIVSGSAVIGIVSRRDLLRMLVRDDDVIRSDVAHRVDAYTGGRTRWQVDVREGRVDLSGDVADDAEARVLTILAQTVPGVTHVDLHRTHPDPRSTAPHAIASRDVPGRGALKQPQWTDENRVRLDSDNRP